MPDGPPRTSRWKRRILRILAVVAVAPLLLLLLGNLALATPWSRAWLGQRISSRLGVEASVGRATVTPWGGAVLGDLTLRQPPALRGLIGPPLLEVRSIRVVPRWRPLLQGKVEIDKIRIEGPRAVVAVEMLASLVSAAASRPGSPPGPPALAVVPRPPGPGPGPGPSPGPAAVPPAAIVTPPPVPAGGPEAAPPVARDPRETAWLEIVDASLELRSAGRKSGLCEFGGIDARIPVAGKAARSEVKLARCGVLGRTVASGWVLPLSWDSPELRIGPGDLAIAGLAVKLAAAVGRAPGMPFVFELTVPPQALAAAAELPDLRPAAERVEARLQGLGLLRLPATWQGAAAVEAARPGFRFGGDDLRFDQARATVLLQGGVLQCPEARLISDTLSLLGNGRIRADGEGSAVLRIVVPPGTAAALAGRFTVPGMPAAAPVFKPLGTPDRLFLDLRWTSYSGVRRIELGEGGPVLPGDDPGRFFRPPAAE